MDPRESAVEINPSNAPAVALRCRAPIGEWTTDDFDVLADRAVVGGIVKATLRRRMHRGLGMLAQGRHRNRAPMRLRAHASNKVGVAVRLNLTEPVPWRSCVEFYDSDHRWALHVHPLRPTRPRSSCFDALLSAFSKLDNVTPSSRMPLAGGNTVRTRSMLTLRKVS